MAGWRRVGLVGRLLAGVIARMRWASPRLGLVAVAGLLVAIPAATGAVDRSFSPVPQVEDLGKGELPAPGDAVEVLRARAAAEQAADQLAQRRATPSERQARERSRTAFAGTGRALAVGVQRRELPALMASRLWSPPRLEAGEQITGYLNDHMIKVRRPGHPGAVLYSPEPVAMTDANGDRTPVDLSLVEHQDDFATKASPVGTVLPKDLRAGIAMARTGVTVRPDGDGSSSMGVEQDGKVFWSDVTTDTDFMVAPLTNGFETFHLLRSAAAPERLSMRLDLPAGASLRRAPAAHLGLSPRTPAPADGDGVQIMRDGQVIGTISDPVAVDADGEPVDSTLHITDSGVAIDVAHRDADVKYPITVDPVYSGYVVDNNTWRDGYASFAGWQYQTSNAGYFNAVAGNSAWGNGLYVGAIANAPYCCNQYGQWVYFAPGSSFIYRADLTGMYYTHSGSTYYAGIAKVNYGWQAVYTNSTAFNNAYTTICVSDCGPSGALQGNNFAFGQIMYGATGPSSVSYVGRVYLTMSDNDSPAVSVLSTGAPSNWVPATSLGAMTAQINSSDPGLGVAAEDIVIDAPWRTTTRVGALVQSGCGDRDYRCANSSVVNHGYDIRDYLAASTPTGAWDGSYLLTPRVWDAVNHMTAGPPWRINVDSNAPNLALSGGLAGMDGRELTGDSYKLVMDADDTNPFGASRGSSGVASITVKVDGQAQTPLANGPGSPACPGNACTLHNEWTLSSFGLSVGSHTITVEARDFAGNVSSESISVIVQRGVMDSPRTGDVSEGTFALHAVAKSGGYSYASFQYRKTPSEAWTTITGDSSTGTLTAAGSPVTGPVALANSATPTLVWTPPQALGSDYPLQLRAIFGTAASGSGAPDPANPSTTVNASYRLNGIGADYDRQDLAPGEVDLLTGNFVMPNSDVSVATPTGDLTLTRTYASRLATAQAGPFGPGWVASGSVAGAGADYVNITEQGTAGQTIAVLTLDDGTTLEFSQSSSAGAFRSPPGYEDLTLSKDTSTPTGAYTLTDTDANTTTFTIPSSATADWRPSAIKTAADNSTSTVTYAIANGHVVVASVRGPLPSGVADCNPPQGGGVPAGCRELRFTYAPSTTAQGTSETQWGDYNGRLSTVTFFSGDNGAPASGIAIASYLYDNDGGHLRAQWDPRISPALKTTYDYNADGLLTKVTPPGEQPWTLSYQPASGEPASTGRLRAITRTGPSGTATRTVVYKVALSGTDAPYAMDTSTVGRWGQTDVPTTATAIFPADGIPSGDQVTSTTPATVYYMDASGQIVNTAQPGANISATEYDVYHNVIRSLTAANRARAMALYDANNPSLSVNRAKEIDTQSIYGANGLEKIEQFGPQHQMLIAANTVQARSHTVIEYDGGDHHLPTRTMQGARIAGAMVDSDVRVTTNDYDATGIKLRKPTTTTIDPSGLNLATRYSYDAATGAETGRTMPKGNPATPSAYTTKTTLYAAGGTGACTGKPEWAGLPCRIEPAAQPSGAPLPITTITYNQWQQHATTTETVGASDNRTTTTTYDAAGRVLTASVSATAGTSLPTVTHGYSPSTGRETTLSTAADKTITRTYDSLGRLISYQDADGATSTTTYDSQDRPLTADDGKGSQTRTYDPIRGLLTTLDDSQAGTFTATYDADGTITTRGLPSGLTATSTIDEAGNETRRTYSKASNCGASCTWVDSQAPVNAHDQRASQTTTTQTGQLSQATYTYDIAGRLATVNDTPTTQGCTIRQYGYDADSNRVALTSKPPASGGACQPSVAGTTTTPGYDEADRLTTTGVTYDAFGRTLTVPAPSAGGSTLTATYYANDRNRTLTQDGLTQTYTLDPARRIETRTSSGTSTATETDHYSDDSDSPSWIANTADGSSYTRQIESIDGDLAAVRDSNGTRLQLANIHGDVVAEASTSPSATSLLRSSDNDEYGMPRSQQTNRNQWLASKQRPTELKSGAIAMGQRTYVPQLGRFLQVDPVMGGSANHYDYALQDPMNVYDLEGNCVFGLPCPKAVRKVGKLAKKVIKGGGKALSIATATEVCTGVDYLGRRIRRERRDGMLTKKRFWDARPIKDMASSVSDCTVGQVKGLIGFLTP